MLHILEIPPKAKTLTRLDTFQAEVDRIPVDDNWKKRLDATWAKYYDDPDFVDIKDCLAAMCPGRMRCCYCEDSAAEGIDHIAPKALFPQSTFAWSNYIYACAVCNKKKSDTWALFVPNGVNRTFTRIPRHRKGHPRKFPTGTDHVFINPRVDDPSSFLELVIDPKYDKLDFRPIVSADNGYNQIRADYTVKTLKINSEYRPNLAKSRMDAYHDYQNRLKVYAHRKLIDFWDQSRLDPIIARFNKSNHVSVWFEIKRLFQGGQLARIDSDFYDLLTTVPEALTW